MAAVLLVFKLLLSEMAALAFAFTMATGVGNVADGLATRIVAAAAAVAVAVAASVGVAVMPLS